MARVVALGGDGRDIGRTARRGLCAVGQAVAVVVAPFPIGIDGGTPAGLGGKFAGLAEGERDVRRVDRDVAVTGLLLPRFEEIVSPNHRSCLAPIFQRNSPVFSFFSDFLYGGIHQAWYHRNILIFCV